MTDQRTLLQTATVRSADDLADLWRALLGSAGFDRRTLWLLILDEAGHPAPVIVPIDDIPLLPGSKDVEAFAAVLAGIAGLGTPALLLSRPGDSAVEEGDRSWARVLAPLAPAWPVHRATAAPSAGIASGQPAVEVLALG